MKFVLVLAIVAVVAARPEDDEFTRIAVRYENFDTEEVINNDRLLKAYSHCICGTGKCTPEGSDFKKLAPEAIQSSCGKCSDKQKRLIAKLIAAVQAKLPEEWDELNKTYNPDGKYDGSVKEFLEKYKH